MAEREIKARLDVEESGDPQAFADLARDLETIQDPAASAEERLAALDRAVERLGDDEPFEGFAEQLRQMASAARDFLTESDPSKKLDAIRRAEEAWKRVGSALTQAGGAGSKAFDIWASGAEEFRASTRNLGDPIELELRQATAAVEDFAAKSEKGTEAVEAGAARARLALNKLREEVEALQKEGGSLGDGQAAALARLEARYRSGVQASGRYRQAQREVTREIDAASVAAGQQIRTITDLGDVAELLGGRWAQLALQGAAVVGSFKAGWEVGTQLRQVLNALTQGRFDQTIQSWVQPMADFVTQAERAEGAAGRIGRAWDPFLARQREAFEELGIGMQHFTDDVDKNAQIIVQAATSSEQAWTRFVDSLGLSFKDLEARTQVLFRNIDRFREANQQLTDSQLAEIFHDQIQEVLDAYVRLGQVAPPNLVLLAESWGILTSRGEAAAEKHKALVQSIVEEIEGAARVTREQIEAETRALVEALGKIEIPKLRYSDPEAFERAKQRVQELVDVHRQAGIAIPAELSKAADAVGVFVAAMERGRGEIRVFSGASDDLSGSSQQLTRHVDELGRVSYTVTEQIRGAGAAAKQAGADVSSAGEGIQQAAGALEGQGEAGEAAATGVSAAATATEHLGSAASSAGEGLRQVGGGLSELAGSAQPAADALTTIEDRIANLSKLTGWEAGITTGLKAIVTEAQAAAAALDEVENTAEAA